MWNWPKIFRRAGRRVDTASHPEVELVRTLARQISIPQKAGPVLQSLEAFAALDATGRRSELPRMYLLLEQYLTDFDPVRKLSRQHLRDMVSSQYTDLVCESPFSLVFEPADRQELLLCRDFLLDVLGRAINIVGGGSNLAAMRLWIAHAPEPASAPAPLAPDDDPPQTVAEWTASLTTLAQSLYAQLRVGLGEATGGIYNAAYAALAHRYAGLETFPIVVRLLPDGLLDEERIQSVARHATMARVQGELSEAKRSALDTATQLQAVLSTVGEGIITVDAEGAIVLVNREIERTFEYESDALIGVELSTLLALEIGDPLSFFECLGERVSAEGRRSNGSTFPVEVCINETRISGHLFYTAAVRDVTIQRKYERDLLTAKEHAEEMTRLKTAFVANMSHEIRTPLSGIMGAVQILEEEIPDDQKEFTRMAYVSARRLLTTLDAVLEFARLESGEVEFNHGPVQIADVLEDACARFTGRAHDKDLILRMEPVASGLAAQADTDSLARILDVLIENAIRFTHRGRITVAAAVEGDGAVRIAIRDEGIGISPAFLPHIFDEFRQESTGHSRTYEGTGLGLAIALRHAKALDGRLEVESTPGRGSTFSLVLPAAAARERAGTRAASRSSR